MGLAGTLLSRRRWAAVCRVGVAALVLAWLAPVPGRSALEFDLARVQQTMQSRFGAQGVQALQDWLRMLEAQAGRPPARQLQAVNDFWNHTVLGSDDMVVWGEADYWATPLESLGKRAGDCEDFVIGKYFSLMRLGVPVEKLRLIYVRARVGGGSAAGARLVFADLGVAGHSAGTFDLGESRAYREVVRGQGKVVPSRQVQVVQSLDGGIVKEMHVKHGRWQYLAGPLVAAAPAA